MGGSSEGMGIHALHVVHVQVRDVRLLRHSDTNRVKGAFVEFEELKDAEYALSLNGEAAGGRNLRINVAQGRGMW